MRIGFNLPQVGPLTEQAADIAGFAREAETMGVAGLWVGDRLLGPVRPSVGYPPGADSIPEEFHRILDPFAVLSIAAAVTTKVVLGSNVLNAPWYAPAVLARSLTTIDVVSGGRLIAGFGVGWSPEEFQAAGVPFTERGRRLDETLSALEQLWTSDVAEYHGEHWTVPATYARLKPVRRPRPPIYLGGFAPAAFRRVARHADGWLPVLPVPGDIDPGAAVTGPLTEIRRLAEQYGRDPASIDVILRVNAGPTATADDLAAATRRAAAATGIEHVLVDTTFAAKSIDHALEIAGSVLGQV